MLSEMFGVGVREFKITIRSLQLIVIVVREFGKQEVQKLTDLFAYYCSSCAVSNKLFNQKT